ncbi:long-chain-fatty-acid--CoA ligase [Pseudorhodoplanes sp.]|uniref:long-chain-fatty-acid--CoA ligase n=1 Tax=Pseudorhodoplanes sp. TaxID=1934341 RepID=UPI003D0D321C
MQGLMQDWPLLCHRILDHAATYHADRPIVSRMVEGPLHHTTYGQLRGRALRVAQRLERDGIRFGDRVATLAWNGFRHVEAWYGIMGIGAVYHTVNPRLFADQIAWIVNHAEDRVIMTDLTFVPLLEKLADRLPGIERTIVLTDEAHMPQTHLKNAVPYEEWIGEADGDFAWKSFDENSAAGMCYTSGTTGHPKGVLYSHRSNVLHSMMASMGDAMGVSSRDVIMPVVPMFHANCWGLALTAPMNGAALVMPGMKMDGASIYQLLDAYRVTCTAAVPTIWLMLLQHLEATGMKLPHLNRVVIGGSACPRAMTETFEREYGVEVIHAWGMTEMSPLGSLCTIKPEYQDLAGEALLELKVKQGHPPFGVEMRITDDSGRDQPWDGRTFGRLKVRGPAVARAYFKDDADILDEDGFFDTGDVATIDRFGYMQITDRSKDVIKSGGEWISSIDLENLAVGHPKVAEAAVIGVKHPKWGERPLLVVVLGKDSHAEKAELLAFMRGKVADWWLPDDVVFVDEIPHTATGKIQKTALRERFRDYILPGSVAAE